MNNFKKPRPIKLPHWVDIKKLNPPFYREMKTLNQKERKLLTEYLEQITTPLVAAGG